MNRRRFIQISACGVAALAVPVFLNIRPSQEIFKWKGMALGADASIQLYNDDNNIAQKLVRECFSEIQRLEEIFSLYKPDSALSILNRNGKLDNAPDELIELISESILYGNLTNGAFDITVQPLWELYSKSFDQNKAAPKVQEIQKALELIDYKKIHIDGRNISLEKDGMAITLNGIAQGYITDKITELLQNNNMNNILVEMGEMRALGSHPDGTPWRVGIKDPEDPKTILETIDLNNSAISTSGGYGTKFDLKGIHHHIFNPKNGQSANNYKSISVIAPTATKADALSTAFSMMPENEVRRIEKEMGDITVIISRKPSVVSQGV